MRRRRTGKGNNLSHQHDILDGMAQIFRVAQSGQGAGSAGLQGERDEDRPDRPDEVRADLARKLSYRVNVANRWSLRALCADG